MEICSGTNLIQPVTVALATSTASKTMKQQYSIFALSKNQESGSLGIFCGVCNRTFDSSLVNLRKKPLIQQYLAILTLYSLDMFKRTKELSTRIMMSILSMTLNLMQINSS